MTKPIVIYGAGGFAREVAWLIESCSSHLEPYQISCFIDDNVHHHGLVLNDIPVMGVEEASEKFHNAYFVVAIGSPQVRQVVAQKALKFGFIPHTLIHPRTEYSRWVTIGEGNIICAGNILTTNIVLGKQVHINLDCTLGHDVILGDYTTLAPGVHISGWVHIKQRVYIGTGAVIINGTADAPIIIDDDVVIGAGACVTKSVAQGQTVVGVPARPR